MPVTLPCDATREALNADPEFRLNAQHWNAAVKLKVGDRNYLMRVVDGTVEEFKDEWDAFDVYTITIGGPEEGWEQMLKPIPPPFYQDFWGAFFRHDFEMGGDLESLYANYGAVRRMLEVLRATRNGAEA